MPINSFYPKGVHKRGGKIRGAVRQGDHIVFHADPDEVQRELDTRGHELANKFAGEIWIKKKCPEQTHLEEKIDYLIGQGIACTTIIEELKTPLQRSKNGKNGKESET